MQLKNLFDDDTAVSPVIGVILMVAITVILAAVIGTFVLGLGDSIGENAPSASYDWDQDTVEDESGDNTNASILTHVSGENIDGDRVTGTQDGTALNHTDDGTLGNVWADGGSVSSGDTVEIIEGNSPDNGQVSTDTEDSFDDDNPEFRVVWTASGGGSSSTLTTYTWN